MHRNRDVFCVESDEGLMSPRQAFTPTHRKGGGTAPTSPRLGGHFDSGLGFTPITAADGEDKGEYDEAEENEESVQWSWEFDHDDRKRETEADRVFKDYGPLLVERAVLKAVVKEKMGAEVVRIVFLSSGTFHKAYLITLSNRQQIVARVARRFMPRLKTESEVATMAYIGKYTDIPVPTVYHYDSSPYNRLGGEYILMSKAKGVALAKVYHSLTHHQLVQLLTNLAHLLIPVFAHRFPALGSLYFGASAGAAIGASTASSSQYPGSNSSTAPSVPGRIASASNPLSRNDSNGSSSGLTPKPGSFVSLMGPVAATPRASASSHATPSTAHDRSSLGAFPFSLEGAASGHAKGGDSQDEAHGEQADSVPFHVGPIISWPFFGSNRGDIPSSPPSSSKSRPISNPPSILIGLSASGPSSSSEPTLNRGPFSSTAAYLSACSAREVQDVTLENAGKAAPHRLHLDPDVIKSSYRHSLRAFAHEGAGPGPSLGDGGVAGRSGTGPNVKSQGSKRVRDGGGAGRRAAYPSVLGYRGSNQAAPKGYDNGEDYYASYPSSPSRSSFSSSESEDECGSDASESEGEWEEYRAVGDRTYRDYRRMQRGTFLVKHLEEREQTVKREMGRWVALMDRLMARTVPKGAPGSSEGVGDEEFGLDCHDLSLENIFVDAKDHTRITTIIDWESTTTRPLWQCAHLPAFLQSSPFAADLFRSIVKDIAAPNQGNGKALDQPRPRPQEVVEAPSRLPTTGSPSSTSDSPRSTSTATSSSGSSTMFSEAQSDSTHTSASVSQNLPSVPSKLNNSVSTTLPRPPSRPIPPSLAEEWLLYESAGLRLRMAHRFVEWDGWEEGLIDTMLGSEEQECEWFAGLEDDAAWPPVLPEGRDGSRICLVSAPERVEGDESSSSEKQGSDLAQSIGPLSAPLTSSTTSFSVLAKQSGISQPKDILPSNPLLSTHGPVIFPSRATRLNALNVNGLAVTEEKQKTQMLNSTGDICGGRGGELGRRLEAWLSTGAAGEREGSDQGHK